MRRAMIQAVPFLVLCGVFFVLAVGRVGAAAELSAGIFATVDGQVITGDKFLAVFRGKARGKFYHGKAPEGELAAFPREVGEYLILRALLAREAERRGLQADEGAVAARMAKLEKTYAGNPQWAEHREKILSDVGRQLRVDTRIKALEDRIRNVNPPSESQVRAYYRQHADKFTTPERVGVSVILLRVTEIGVPERWEQAWASIVQIAAKLQQGGDFAELARLHSQGPSADEGGNLGLLHRDMLAGVAQEAVTRLSVGETSPPVRLLEGYALFRLNGRQPARLNPFEKVRERAEGLWLRQARDDAWTNFGEGLRRAAVVQINDAYYRTAAAQGRSPAPRR